MHHDMCSCMCAMHAEFLTWRVLRSRQRGHGVGQVKVGSDAQLALNDGWIWRGWCTLRLLAPFLFNPRKVGINQSIQKLNHQFSIIWDLGLLQSERKQATFAEGATHFLVTLWAKLNGWSNWSQATQRNKLLSYFNLNKRDWLCCLYVSRPQNASIVSQGCNDIDSINSTQIKLFLCLHSYSKSR